MHSEPMIECEGYSLAGHRILVTGASSGIGRATAVLAAQRGASVALVGRHQPRLEETLEMMVGDEHTIHNFDLSEADSVDRLFAESGPTSDIIHAAGTQVTSPVRVLTDKQINDLMTINVHAALRLARAFSKRKNRTPTPHAIVLVSSVMGLVGVSGGTAYSAAKSAIGGIVRSLGVEFAPIGIRVNAVAPGYVHTPLLEQMNKVWTEDQRATVESLHPLGFGEPRDVAGALLFLCSSEARWITGTVLPVDGGYTAR